VISDIVIEDYQSVRKARLGLGRFTVVTGPSGSGKSAVVRAMELVAFNDPAPAYIRHGAKTCKVALGFRSDAVAVGIERGGRGADKYLLSAPADQPDDPPQVTTFTKLDRKVPVPCAERMRLQPINFAGQLDGPFLLADSGSQVARTIGELTNVTMVLNAAREANRRKQEFARELKTWEKSLASLREQLQEFRTLQARQEAARQAQEALAEARELEARQARLGALWSSLRLATSALDAADAAVSAWQVPSVTELDDALARLRRLRVLRDQHCEATQAEANWDQCLVAAAREEDAARKALSDVLAAAGTCPTCGSSVGGKS
jgi:exonuclease SbcC